MTKNKEQEKKDKKNNKNHVVDPLKKNKKNKMKWITEMKPKKKSFIPIVVIILIALLIATVLPWIKDAQQFSDTKDVWLNQLEQNFTENKYSEIVIDENKAIATYTGWTVNENWTEKIKEILLFFHILIHLKILD